MNYDMREPRLWVSMGKKVLSSHGSVCPIPDQDCVFTPRFWLLVESAALALDHIAAEEAAVRQVAW